MVEATPAKPQRDVRRGLARRWLVRCLVLALAMVVLSCVGVLLLLTPAAGLVLRPQLESQMGVLLEGGTLRLDSSGDVVIKGVDFRTRPGPGAPVGESSRFLTIEDGRILLGWKGAFRGQPLVRRVDIFDAQVRLSKPVDDFDLNILAIAAPKGGSGGALPGIVVHRASVLLGEHDSTGAIQALRTLPLSASLRGSRARPGTYDVSAHEVAALSTSVRPLRFEGSLGPDGFSGRLGAFDMADFPPEAIPVQLREFYRELAIGGRARGATLRYDRGSDVLELTLDVLSGATEPAPFPEDSSLDARLDLRLPVPTDEAGTLRPLIPASGSGKVKLVQRPAPEAGRGVAWRDVQAAQEPGEPGLGRRTLMLEAALDSTIEDAHVRLDARVWLGGAEPLYQFTVDTAEPYVFGPDTAWLQRPSPVIGKIREVLAMFEPSGTVEFGARVSQVAHAGGVRQRVEGGGTFRDASMRYEKFPYPVRGITGDIVLDDGQVRLENIKGRTAGGGEALSAVTIRIDEVATGVDVDVQAFNVPYDDTLRQALDDVAPAIRRIALNEDALRGLIARGIVRGPGMPGRMPAFALGGEADAVVRVRRQAGVPGSTSVEVVARTTNFGFVPEAFPVPVVGRDVVVNVFLPSELETTLMGVPRSLRVWAEGARATSLAGGDIGLRLDVAVPIDDVDDTRTTTVDLEIEARGVPVHEAVLAAVPVGEGTMGPGPILRGLHPAGTIDALVRVTRDQSGEVGWSAEVTPRELTLRPRALDRREGLWLDAVTGTVRVDALGLRADVGARSRRGGTIRANLRAGFEDGGVLAIFTSEGLNLETPVEDAIALVSPDLARSLADLREAYDVRGRADVSASVRVANGVPAAEVRVARLDGVRFDWLGGRMGLDEGRGSIVVSTTDEGPLLAFDRVAALGSYRDESIGRVRLRGEIPIDALREGGARFSKPTRMGIELQGGRLDSPLLRTLAGERGGGRLRALLDEYDPRGEYDAMVGLDTAAYTGGDTGQKPLRTFELSPYEFSMLRDGRRVGVPWVSGLLTGRELAPSPTGPGGATTYAGLLDNLTLGGDGWWVSFDGGWSADGQGHIVLDAALDGEVGRALGEDEARPFGLPGPLVAIAPPGVAGALEGVAFENAGDLSLRNGRLHARARPGWALSVEASASVGIEAFRAGLRPTKEGIDKPMVALRDTVLDVRASSDNPDSLATLQWRSREGEVWGLEAAGVGILADVRRDGTVEIPRLVLGSGGGRLAGRGGITLPGASGEPGRFEFEVAGAGLHTERLIAAVQDRDSRDVHGAGDMDLSLGLAGNFGEPSSVRGRGSLRIRGGSPVDLPLPIRATVEALNVTFGADRYDSVNGEFYIDGAEMTFTRLAVSSDSVVLDGLGTVGLEDGQLDMRLSTRPIRDTTVRALLRFLREVIVSVELRGTLDNPSPAPKPQALVGPLDALRRFIKGGLTYEEWKMERLRRFDREYAEPSSGW